jgi:hypothetical protein
MISMLEAFPVLLLAVAITCLPLFADGPPN